MFTLQDFIELPLFPWYKIVSGHSVMEQTTIDFVSVIEVPVDDFVRKNELVLSTALGHELEPSILLRLVTDIYSSGASALVLATPSNALHLTKDAERFAFTNNFPIIIIPWECRFAEIVETVLKEIWNHRLEVISMYETIQKKLLSAFLDGQKITIVAEILSDFFKQDVVIVGMDYTVKSCSHLKYYSWTPEEWQQQNLILLKNGMENHGYLYLSNPDTGFDHELLQQYLLSPIVLWFHREWVIYATQENSKDDFIWKLSQPNGQSKEEILARGRLLGLHLEHPYTCIVGAPHPESSLNLTQCSSRQIELVLQSIKHSASDVHRLVMTTCQSGILLVYLQNIPHKIDQTPHLFLDEVEAKFRKIFPDTVFYWGMSEINMNINDFKEIFQDATLAQELSCADTENRNRYTHERTIIFRVLSHLHADPTIKKQIGGIVAPLLDYSQGAGMDLMNTLRVYINTQNISQAARELHLHRQSLLYRLDKIEKLTGLSLKNGDDLFLLALGSRLTSSSAIFSKDSLK